MNRKNIWMAGLLALTLCACSSDNTRGNATDTTGGTGNSGSSSMAGAGGASGTDGDNPDSPSAAAALATPQISYGTVQAIDPMTRQDVGVGAVGAAAASGGMGAPADKVYRVTVKMDDGSSQMVAVDAMPGYKTSDRVRYSNGILQQY